MRGWTGGANRAIRLSLDVPDFNPRGGSRPIAANAMRENAPISQKLACQPNWLPTTMPSGTPATKTTVIPSATAASADALRSGDADIEAASA